MRARFWLTLPSSPATRQWASPWEPTNFTRGPRCELSPESTTASWRPYRCGFRTRVPAEQKWGRETTRPNHDNLRSRKESNYDKHKTKSESVSRYQPASRNGSVDIDNCAGAISFRAAISAGPDLS